MEADGEGGRIRGAGGDWMPRFTALPSLLQAVALLVSPPTPSALTARRVCKPAIQRCVGAGGNRRHCRRQLIQQCRQLGQQLCDEAFLLPTTLPPTTTTSTTTSTTFRVTTTTTTIPGFPNYAGTWSFY